MAEAEPPDGTEPSSDFGTLCDALVASLRQQGGDRLDPVRFHFLEALAKRAQAQPAPVRRVLDAKLGVALAAYQERLRRAANEVGDTVMRKAEQISEGGDPQHVAPPASGAQWASLAGLVTHIRQQAAGDCAGEGYVHTELKSLRHFGDRWSQLSADRAVTQALATGPANAGPLNSHSLVLQSLAVLRDSSPDYLRRFMAYADALLWLDQANRCGAPSKPSAGRGESRRRRKSKGGE
jgi:hypothetical protein